MSINLTKKQILKTTINKLIEIYFNKKELHTIFNDWFNEFLEITDITTFDKEKGYSVYHLKNDNKLIVYTLEKLNDNKQDLCELIGISEICDENIGDNKWYKNLYKKMKQNITYNKEYLDSLLDTKIMKMFYTDEDIQTMYKKYKQCD